jgi:hypothetical protein
MKQEAAVLVREGPDLQIVHEVVQHPISDI